MADLMPFWASWQLDSFRDYVKTMSTALQKEFAGFAERASKELELADDDNIDDARTLAEFEANRLQEEFPALCMGTTFVALITFLEDDLYQICDRQREIYRYKLAVKDITGRGIDQCSTYLAKVCNIVDPTTLPEWPEIKSFQLMRNIFVHRRGRFDDPESDNDKKVKKYLDGKSPQAEEVNGHIVLKEQFCQHAIEVVRKFVDGLFASIKAKAEVQAAQK